MGTVATIGSITLDQNILQCYLNAMSVRLPSRLLHGCTGGEKGADLDPAMYHPVGHPNRLGHGYLLSKYIRVDPKASCLNPFGYCSANSAEERVGPLLEIESVPEHTLGNEQNEC